MASFNWLPWNHIVLFDEQSRGDTYGRICRRGTFLLWRSVSCRWCFGEAARKRGRGRSESVRGGERYFLGHCLAGEENQRREVGIRAEEVCFLEAAQEEF